LTVLTTARVAELEHVNKELEDEKSILASQAAQDKHYSQCAEQKVEQIMLELLEEQERTKTLQAELEQKNAEIAKMSKKLISRNAELKLYKVRKRGK
jgi:uncharacterized protein YgiM (DUF1202 family)